MAAAYANSLSAELTLDNKARILEDPRIREVSPERLALIFGQDYWWPGVTGLYRPVTTLSLLFNYAVLGNGAAPAGYHLLNLALHGGVAVLVWLLGLHLLGRPRRAFAAAALFALHPIATEAVTNVIGRADLMAAAAVIGGLLLHARASVDPDARHRSWLRAALGAVVLLGFLAKETAATLLGVAILYDVTYRFRLDDPGGWRPALRRLARAAPVTCLPIAVPLVAVFVVRAWVFSRLRLPVMTVEDNPIVAAGFWTGRLTAIRVIGDDLLLLFWPRTLSCDYSYRQVPLFGWSLRGTDLWAVAALAIALAILGGAALCYRRSPAAFFFVSFGAVTFLPTANLVLPIGALKAERFLYLPLLGFCACLVLGIDAGARRLMGAERSAPATSAVVAVLALACGLRTAIRNRDWHDDLTLWTAAVRAAPQSFKTHLSLAAAIHAHDPEARRIDEAIAQAEQALAISDHAELVLLHLGEFYRVKGDVLAVGGAPPDQSEAWYHKSEAILDRAIALTVRSDAESRERERARGRRPDQIKDVRNPEIYFTAALTDMRLKELDRALDAFAQMRAVVPNLPAAYAGRAAVHSLRGQDDLAALELAEAWLLDGGQPASEQQWAQIYRRRPVPGCAVSASGGIDLSCPEVHAVVCQAHQDLESTFAAAREGVLAAKARQSAEAHGCGR